LQAISFLRPIDTLITESNVEEEILFVVFLEEVQKKAGVQFSYYIVLEEVHWERNFATEILCTWLN